MKKLLTTLLLIFTFSIYAHAQTDDQYENGYDDAIEKQGQWSDNEEYQDGYEDAQRLLEEQERQEEERRERLQKDD